MASKTKIKKAVHEECKKWGHTNVKIHAIYPGAGISHVDLEYVMVIDGKEYPLDTTWLVFEHVGGRISFEY